MSKGAFLNPIDSKAILRKPSPHPIICLAESMAVLGFCIKMTIDLGI